VASLPTRILRVVAGTAYRIRQHPNAFNTPMLPWDSAIHQSQVRFDARAERAEYDRLFRHAARVLQDRMARRSRTDRTRKPGVAEWEKVYQNEAQERRVLYQARVLGWGKEKQYYFAHKPSEPSLPFCFRMRGRL